MSDLISRQAAIDALRTCYDTETVTMDNGDEYINYGDAVGEIEQLPSTQPEPCEDAVSRQAAIDVLDAYQVKIENGEENPYVWGRLRMSELLPVTPKQRTGKCRWCERLKERNLRIEYYWIDEEGCTASFSEPHIVATGIAKFCPNCGAKITEGDAE